MIGVRRGRSSEGSIRKGVRGEEGRMRRATSMLYHRQFCDRRDSTRRKEAEIRQKVKARGRGVERARGREGDRAKEELTGSRRHTEAPHT